MKRALVITLLLAFGAPAARASWGDAKIWDDGRAEVGIYDSERVDGGKPRTFREQIIISKEDLRADTLTKAENKKAQKTLRAFKMNQVVRYDTENYPVTFLTTVFAPEDTPERPLKIAVGSQDWDGNSFKVLTVHSPDRATLGWNSHFDEDAASTELALTPKDVFDDQLPLAIRSMPLKEGFHTEVRLWDNLTSGHAVVPVVSTAVITVEGEDLVRCHAGSLPSWKVTVARPSRSDTYWFEKAEPRILTRMETSDGRKRLLYGRARWMFWDRRFPRPNILN